MPNFSRASLIELEECHDDLQKVMHEAIKYFDFKVIEGYRGKEAQDEAFRTGKSKIKWPNGKHNKLPSEAVDIAPYPIVWNDVERFVYLAGHIVAIGAMLGVKLKWGGDWNRDTQVKDEKFRDFGHFELVKD